MTSKLQGPTSHKATTFILAVKTLKLTYPFLFENNNKKQSKEISSSIMSIYIHANSTSDHSEKLI
jgi:hypothetical protein